jgi:hypothetical protein
MEIVWEGCSLLHALGARFGVDQGFKDGENVATVIDHAREDIPQQGLALGLAVPFEQHRWRDFDVAPELFGGVPAQEQAVEEGRLALREVKIVLGFFGSVNRGWERRIGFNLHQRPETERAVYRKFSRRQVVPRFRDIKTAMPANMAIVTACFDARGAQMDSGRNPMNEHLPSLHRCYQKL